VKFIVRDWLNQACLTAGKVWGWSVPGAIRMFAVGFVLVSGRVWEHPLSGEDAELAQPVAVR